jgi:glycine cleavage system aminomethyltransferase T
MKKFAKAECNRSSGRYVNMGYASGVMVFAVTQTGEPGYSLYIPSEYALHLYNKIMTVRAFKKVA